MSVETTHSDYDDSLPKWKLVRTCVAGAQAVRKAGVLYLPNPEAEDPTNISKRYTDFKARAQFLNVTGRTRNAMVGMAFRKEPEVEITGIEYIEDNATGSGTSLEQLGKIVTGDLLEVGRIGLLTDYPESGMGLSKEQITGLGLKASIKTYTAESITNWDTMVVGGENVLSEVRLKESYTVYGERFSQEEKTQYRVLSLIDNVYTVEIFRDEILFGEPSQPRANGSFLNRIPFIIAGAYSNDPDVDAAALYDIAEINIGHYVNSADYEEGIHLHGQPMLHIDAGITSAPEWDILNPNGVEVGTRRGIVTVGGGTAKLLQAASNGAALEAMTKKEEQMVSIGARTIEPGGQAETAEAARIKHAGDNSVLTNIVQNASAAIEQSLEWAAMFMGINTTPIFNINDDFYDKSIDPQVLMAKAQMLDRFVIAKADIRDSMRKAGELSRTDEEIDNDIDDTSPII